MAIFKNKDIEANINERTVELGNINANFYTEDEQTASIRIFIKWNDHPIDLNKINMKPVLNLYMQDGSLFEGEKVEVVIPEKGIVQYKIPSNVIKHIGKVNAKLFLENENESIHVANFNFTITDSGTEEPVRKELSFNLVDDTIRRIVQISAMDLLGDDFENRLNENVINHLDSKPELYKGPKGDTGEQGIQGPKGEKGERGLEGKPLSYESLTQTQKEELRNNITNQAVTDFVIPDNSITNEKLADASIDKTKADFIQESNNLFNVNNIEYDVLLGLNGSLTTSTNYIMSDYILVNEGETYTTNEKYFGYVIYDRFKNIITGRGQDLANVTIPSNGHYIRLSILNKWLPNFKFYNNKVSTVGSYNIDFKNKPVITENFNKKTAFNKSSYKKSIKNRDFEIVEIFKNASDFKSPSGRLIDSFERTYKDNIKSFRMNTLGNATSEMQIIPSESIPLKGIQEFNLMVYIEDATKLQHIQLIANKEGGGSWSREVKKLKNGWNFLRYYSQEGDLSNWTNAILFRIIAYGYAGQPTEITICDLKAVRPNKAKIIMVNDHGYSNYKNIAHERLKALGIPTTFALNPGRLGAPIPGASSILSQEEIDELAVDPYAEFSYHAWDPTQKASKDMTSEELKIEMAKCTHYLKKNGLYPDYFWRAAFVQNLAPAHDALNEHIEAYACFDETSRFDVYPFKSTYGINRKQIHNIPNESVDTFFDILEKTHCLVVFYTHDISDGGGIHMTNAELDYFVNHVKKGVDNNWLEGTTYAQLRRRYKPDYGKKGEFDFYENI